MMIKTTFYLDSASSDAVSDLPRKFSASKLVRYFLRALMASDAEWVAYLKSDGEAQAIAKFVHSRTLGRL